MHACKMVHLNWVIYLNVKVFCMEDIQQKIVLYFDAVEKEGIVGKYNSAIGQYSTVNHVRQQL